LSASKDSEAKAKRLSVCQTENRVEIDAIAMEAYVGRLAFFLEECCAVAIVFFTACVCDEADVLV